MTEAAYGGSQWAMRAAYSSRSRHLAEDGACLTVAGGGSAIVKFVARANRRTTRLDVPAPIREGRELLDHFYGFSRKDDPDRYLLQNEFRQDAYRIIVIEMHLAIEELVRSFLFEKLTVEPDPGTFTSKENVKFVVGLHTWHLLELAGRLHVLSKLGYEELTRLNAIRNKCSHHWELHSFTVAEKLKNQSREVVPNIDFNGKNLLTLDVMRDEFIPHYGNIYLELWAVHYGVEHDHVYTDDTLAVVRKI